MHDGLEAVSIVVNQDPALLLPTKDDGAAPAEGASALCADVVDVYFPLAVGGGREEHDDNL